MLEINLLPEELQKKNKATGIETEYFLYIGQWLVTIFLFIHIALGGLWIFKTLQLKILNYKWIKLEPKRKILANIKGSAGTSAEARMTGQRVSWAEKLNKLSQHLPAGIWFNNLSLSPKELVLDCSVVSLTKEEMLLINQFISNLNNDPAFFKDFTKAELGAMSRKMYGSYEILDFTITFPLKGGK
jgi:hypothetical protein